MALNNVNFPYAYAPNFDSGRPVYNGYIYIGEPDLDPEVIANQKTIYFVQEDGNQVVGIQPVRTGAGGVPTYNGSPVAIKIDGDYSVKVLNSSQSQVYYSPNSNVSESILNALQTVATLAELQGIPAPALGLTRVVESKEGDLDDGYEGKWQCISGDHSAQLALDEVNGIYAATSDDPTATTKVWRRQFGSAPEMKAEVNLTWFGVRPGVDGVAGFRSALALGHACYLPGATSNYLTSGTEMPISYGFRGDGGERSFIECTNTSASAVIALAQRKAVIEDVGFGFSEGLLTGTEFQGQRVAILTGGTTQGTAFQRGGAIRNVLLKFVGTGVASLQTKEDAGYYNTCFSATFDGIEVQNYTYRGWDFDTETRTGNVYLNIFIETDDANKHSGVYATQDVGFRLHGQENEGVLGQINVERSKVNQAFSFSDCRGFAGGSLHVEDVTLRANYNGLYKFKNTNGMIQSLSAINLDIDTEGWSLIQLDNNYYEQDFGGSPAGPNNVYGVLTIGQINVKRLNRDTAGGGLNNTVNMHFVYRADGKTGPYKLHVTSYSYYPAYTGGGVADNSVYAAFPVRYPSSGGTLTLAKGWVNPQQLQTGGYSFTNLAGSGLTVDTTVSSGVITAVAINAAGTGYVVGKLVNVSGGNANAVVRIDTVGGSGEATAISLLTSNANIVGGGKGYTAATAVATTDLIKVRYLFNNAFVDSNYNPVSGVNLDRPIIFTDKAVDAMDINIATAGTLTVFFIAAR